MPTTVIHNSPTPDASYENYTACCLSCDTVESNNSLSNTMALFPRITSPIQPSSAPLQFSNTSVNPPVSTNTPTRSVPELSDKPTIESSQKNKDGFTSYEALAEYYSSYNYDAESSDENEYF